MADKYTIDFTDQNTNRSFIVTPFSVNGPVNPTSGVLDPMATSASTSLRLVGKGLPEYGERVLENLVHLLEHFAGGKEPTYPINGQIWFNKQVTPQQLCVYNSLHSVLRPSAAHPADVSWYYVDNDQVARLSALQKIRIINGTTGVQEEYTISDVSLKLAATPENSASIDRTEFKISPAPSTSRANAWYIGGWEYILQNNAPLRADFNANNYRIINLSMSNPGAPTDAVNRVYVDTYVGILNGRITAIMDGGALSLDDLGNVRIVEPAENNQVLAYTTDGGLNQWMNKSIVDVSAGAFVLKTGDTITGNLIVTGVVETGALTVSGDITQLGGNISLQSNSISLQSATTIDVQGDVNIDGDMMFVSGSKIILPGTIGSFTQDDQVVNKLYVDAAVGSASTSLTLNALADVTINSSNNDDFLMFDLTTSEWVNRDKTYVAAAFTGEFVPISGGTMSGILILSAHPTAASPSLQAATKGYVDSAIANVSVGGGGTTGGVTGGEYIPDQDLLILHQGAEFVFPVLVVDHINDSFEVDDNFVLVFSEGSTFDVQCSTSASYTVGPTGAVYDVGTNTTIIPVTTAVPSGMLLSSCEINAIPLAGADDINNTFTLLGDHAVDFALGTSFNTICWNTSSSTYTVEAPGASFNSGVDRTVIPVIEDVPAGMLTAGPCRITGTGYGASDVYISMDMGGTTALKTYDVSHPVVGYDQYASDYPTNLWETTLLQNLLNAGASREISLRNIIEEFSTLLGTFSQPKIRKIQPTTGNASYTIFDDSEDYVVGSNDLEVYLNGVKQIASQRAEQTVSGTTKKWPSMDTGLLNTSSYGFRITVNGGVQQQVTFSGAMGDKYHSLISTLNAIGNSTAILSVSAYDTDSNTLVLTGNKAALFPAGKIFTFNHDGAPVSLTVTPGGAVYDTAHQITKIPVTTNLADPYIQIGVTTYPILSVDPAQQTMTISGNHVATFPVGFTFDVTSGPIPDFTTIYTVDINGATYDSGTNRTTIDVVSGITYGGITLTNCTIEYPGLGFGVTMSEKGLRFVSDLSGNGSGIVLVDGATGVTNLFSTLFGTLTYSGINSITTDYGYKEIGSVGQTSNTFEFHAASTPPVGSVLEVIVDRRIIR